MRASDIDPQPPYGRDERIAERLQDQLDRMTPEDFVDLLDRCEAARDAAFRAITEGRCRPADAADMAGKAYQEIVDHLHARIEREWRDERAARFRGFVA